MPKQETPSEIIERLLAHMDDQPTREGLRDTPKRYEKFLAEFLQPQPFKVTTFKNEGYEEMIVQAEIPFYSLCEHHLVPFFGYGAIAYVPNDRIIGLSKLARTLDHFSQRLQNQERITTQVADFLTEAVAPKGVAVLLRSRHLCMEMRGVQKPGTSTTTSCLRGVIKTDPALGAQFLQLATK